MDFWSRVCQRNQMAQSLTPQLLLKPNPTIGISIGKWITIADNSGKKNTGNNPHKENIVRRDKSDGFSAADWRVIFTFTLHLTLLSIAAKLSLFSPPSLLGKSICQNDHTLSTSTHHFPLKKKTKKKKTGRFSRLGTTWTAQIRRWIISPPPTGSEPSVCKCDM